MRWIAPMVLAIGVNLAHAGQDIGLEIHSIKMPDSAEAKIPISVEYSYHGKAGQFSGGAEAGFGVDWDPKTYAATPVWFVPGEHQTATIVVTRPSITELTRTDRVSVYAYPGSGEVIFRKMFEQSIEWKKVDSVMSYGKAPLMAAVDAYVASDYEEVDKIVTYWTETSQISRHGDWKLNNFAKTLETRFARDRTASLKKVREWRAAYPRSRAAALAEASFWVNYAAYIHGHQGPGKVPDEDVLRVVRQYHANAEKVLAESKSYAAGVPLWYGLRLKMAIDGHRDERVITQAFNDAVRAFPRYKTLYVDMATHLIKDGERPRWREFIELADRLDELTRSDNPGAYADLMDHASDVVSGYLPDLFSTRIASWPRVRDSWKELLARYPTPYNLNRYAAMACQALDKESFQTAFGMIGVRIVPGAWPRNLSADVCRNRFLLNS
jgi:hypothetical protein